MKESTPTPNEKYELGDIKFLFDKNDPERLTKKIEAAGYEIISDSYENGERITEVSIPEGNHVFSFGFRQIDPTEERWFHGGLDNKEKREEEPFTFDTESLEFRRICNEFSLCVESGDTLETIVYKLDTVIQRKVTSDIQEEDAHSLSEILQAGRAACASKTVLSGSILKELYPDLRVESVYGYYGIVNEKVSLPFGHEWLRVSDGTGAVLYDSMYKKIVYYPFDTKPEKTDPFDGYTVAALPFGKLQSMIRLDAVDSSLEMVSGYADSAPELVVAEDKTVETQLGGHMTAVVGAKGGILRLVNGNISNEVSVIGPRLLYPLLHIAKY